MMAFFFLHTCEQTADINKERYIYFKGSIHFGAPYTWERSMCDLKAAGKLAWEEKGAKKYWIAPEILKKLNTPEDWHNLCLAAKECVHGVLKFSEDQLKALKESGDHFSIILKKQAEAMKAKRKKARELVKKSKKTPLTTKEEFELQFSKSILSEVELKTISIFALAENFQQNTDRIETILASMKLDKWKEKLDVVDFENFSEYVRTLEEHLLAIHSFKEILDKLKQQDFTEKATLQAIVQTEDDKQKKFDLYNQKVIVTPQKVKPKDPKKVVVMLHGLFRDASFFFDLKEQNESHNLVEELEKDNKDTLFIVPQAPTPCYAIIQKGWKWFDIGSVSKPDPKVIRERLKKVIADYVLQLIEDIKSAYPDADIVLLGFSQGAIVVNELLRYIPTDKLKYFISISGAVDREWQNETAQKQNLKGKEGLIFHSPDDDWVNHFGYSPEQEERVANLLNQWGVKTYDCKDTAHDHKWERKMTRYISKFIKNITHNTDFNSDKFIQEIQAMENENPDIVVTTPKS